MNNLGLLTPVTEILHSRVGLVHSKQLFGFTTNSHYFLVVDKKKESTYVDLSTDIETILTKVKEEKAYIRPLPKGSGNLNK